MGQLVALGIVITVCALLMVSNERQFRGVALAIVVLWAIIGFVGKEMI